MNDITFYAVLTCGIGIIAFGSYCLWNLMNIGRTALNRKEPVASETPPISTLQREFQELRSEWGTIRDDMFKYQASIARSWGHIKTATDNLSAQNESKELPDELPLSAADDSTGLVDGGGNSANDRASKKREIMRQVRARNASPSV